MSHVLLVHEALMQMRPGDWHVTAVLCFVDSAELGSWITLMLQSVRLEVSCAGGHSPTVHPTDNVVTSQATQTTKMNSWLHESLE